MDIRSILAELCDAFNAHDLDRIMAFFSDDCVLEMPRGSKPWGSRFEGKPNVRAALATRFEGLPDVHYGNGEHFVDEAANTGIQTCPTCRNDGCVEGVDARYARPSARKRAEDSARRRISCR